MNRFARRENFAHKIRTPLLREHFVYRAFNADDELLYVGCSARLRARWSDHKSTAPWPALTVRCSIAGPYNYETARQIEREAIHTERPLHNGTPERVEMTRLHNRLVEAYVDLLVSRGWEWSPAIAEAVSMASARLQTPEARDEFRPDDLTLPTARRELASALRELRESA